MLFAQNDPKQRTPRPYIKPRPVPAYPVPMPAQNKRIKDILFANSDINSVIPHLKQRFFLFNQDPHAWNNSSADYCTRSMSHLAHIPYSDPPYSADASRAVVELA